MPLHLVRDFVSEPAMSEISPEILIAESNHRIANNLTMIAELGRMRGEELARSGRTLVAGEARDVLLEIAGRIEAVARLHHLLARAAPGGPPNLGSYLLDIALTVINSLSAPPHGPRFLAEVRGGSLAPRQALTAGLIVVELVTNSVKYAHPAGVSGEIRLSCRQAEDGRTCIEVSDDGVGFPEDYDPRSQGGLGLRLAHSLAAQLDGELSFLQTDLGLTARLTIPQA